MFDNLATLNEQQRVAVETTEGPVLVLSGAGTGKTRVLTARIAHILSRNLARPWEVLALTFTNKAANEMKSRVAELGQNCEWVGTFHSICLKILRRNHAAANLRSDFLIFGEDEQKAVLKTVIPALGLDVKKYSPAEWVEKISFYKDTLFSSDKKMSDDFNRIYAAYNAELDRLGGVDFGDIINKTIGMFDGSPDVLQKYRAQFRYILVDEYQDTNVMQNRLLRLLAGGGESPNICCVGDDDQSIYSWRGAEIKNILHFAREYPGAAIIRLEQNYRSGGNILNAATSLIRNNAGRLGKNLRATLGEGEKVRLLRCSSDLEEAGKIADMISDRIERGENCSGFAVLIRNGALSRLLEEEFAWRGIPYRLIGATRFYDRMEIRDVIAYIRLLCFDFDDLSFVRVVSRPRRGIGDATIDRLRDFAGNEKMPMFEALKNFPLKSKQAAAAAEFLGAFDFDWQTMHPADAAETLLDRTGYAKMWAESADADADDRRKNIRVLIRDVIAKHDDLRYFLENVALMTADDERDASGDTVSIMTIHAAKGLEFDTVFLPAWEDGVFPNDMSISEDGLEEERRLAYVALTRAKNHCVISHTDSRMLYGGFQHNQPSRFIAEVDDRFLELPDKKAIRQERKERRERRRERRENRPKSLVGSVLNHPEFGMGVVIEAAAGSVTVAFKNKIRKLPFRDSQFGIRGS
ncbi:MAG: UvrD-helicase domain-containing protein [Rickettsiales bacterium]|jgi:DNA helicase-2/ATP-dependent DNA helicase PcrA|nr:UvrD-helicase domain-containing protein [Rickettsiales bacterium]